MGIHVGRPAVRRQDRCVLEIEPVRRRQIIHPPVPAADMVQDLIHDQADAVRSHTRGQRDELLIAAEAGVNAVMVRRQVTVVGIDRHVAFEKGAQPDRRKSHAVDVVQAVCNALQVTAMAAVGVSTVELVVEKVELVVIGIAVREAVRHDHVNRVGGAQSRDVIPVGIFLSQLERPLDRVLAFREHDVDDAGLRIRTDIEINEQVIRAIHANNPAY